MEGWALDTAGRRFLKVRVSAPALEGAANTAVIQLLSKALGRPKSSMRIISGETARLKVIELDDVTDECYVTQHPKISNVQNFQQK